MKAKVYDGIPFYIGTGKRVEQDNLPDVQLAVERKFRDIHDWEDRYAKGQQVLNAIKAETAGAVQNVNMGFAYNAYFKFLHQSLLSLRDSFRLSSSDYTVDVERPTAVMKAYLDSIQTQNDLIAKDAIIYGCSAILLDVDLNGDTTEKAQPGIMINRVRSAKLIYDFEQPGNSLFTLRITPEVAYKMDFLPEYYKDLLFNRAIASVSKVTEVRVFVGELVVNGSLDTYVALMHHRRVIYAEKERDLTTLRAISLTDSNDDFSPIYTILKASELSRDVYKLIFDYNDQNVNPIRTGQWNLDENVWEEARRTKYLKLSPVGSSKLEAILPGNLDINGLVQIQERIQQLSQQGAGLNEYTLGEATGSVRTAAEAMMLNDSAAGILNILANKLKQQLILPILSDVLEILKLTLSDVTDVFDETLEVDSDIAKDQQEANILMSLINMPMFGAVIQGLQSTQALELFRWILEKLHISGTSSIFDTLIENANNNISNNNNNRRQ